MVETLQDYLCKYLQEQTPALKGCLIAVYDSRLQYLSLLDESLGTPVPSANLKFCELLADAGLFREEVKITRDGRNRYKLFYLTDTGKEMAQQIKAEGYTGPVPQNTPIDNV
jgi:hypothetical protein